MRTKSHNNNQLDKKNEAEIQNAKQKKSEKPLFYGICVIIEVNDDNKSQGWGKGEQGRGKNGES